MTTTLTPCSGTEILYDRGSGDYAMYIEGALIGFAATQAQADDTMQALLAELAHASAVDTADDEADAEAAEVETLVAEIISDYSDNPPISEEEALIVALGMRRGLADWADDYNGRQWSARLLAEKGR